MLRRLIGAAVVATSIVAMSLPAGAQNAPAAATPDAATAVKNVQDFYDKTTTFSSDFQQNYLAKAYNQTKTSKGHVVFSKPGKMDWQYSDPQGNRIVSDGTTLRVYEASNKQMYEQQVGQSQYPAALSFLTGQGRLDQQCNFTVYPGAQLQYTGGYVMLCDPKTPTPAYTKILFYVDAATSQVRRVLILDGQGNRNRFDFENPQVNTTVQPTQFVFTPPPGTSIVKP